LSKNKLTERSVAMSKKDYIKHAERRQRIRRRTLVVGVDIGCNFNAMSFMNKAGDVLGRYPRVYNSRQGFEYFVKVIEGARKTHGFRDVLIGMEPTGHYWRKIAYFAQDQGYEVRFIRTTALRHQRKLDASSAAKSDVKDALTIANIVREGKYIDTIIEDGEDRQLRTLVKARERLKKRNSSAQNALHAALDDYFPEIKEVFYSVRTRGLWAVLKRCPFPEDVIQEKESILAAIIGEASRRRATALQKAKTLMKGARESIGLRNIGRADRYRLQLCLEEVERTEKMLKDMEKEIKKVVDRLPYSGYLLSMPGVGVLSVAVVLGELGNPANFRHARGMVKYAGYDPQESDSGKRIGRRFISKSGRWLLRKYLYFMAMRVVSRSEYFREYYQRKLEAKNRYGQTMRKKEALCAVAIKLIKVIFALLRDKRNFQEVAPVY
jgi:transposase